jgi:hypothetical protein
LLVSTETRQALGDDERIAAEKILQALEIEKTLYKIGLSQVSEYMFAVSLGDVG